MYSENTGWLSPGPSEAFFVDRIEVALSDALTIAVDNVLQALAVNDSERFGELLKGLVLGAAAQDGIHALRANSAAAPLGWRDIAQTRLLARADDSLRQHLHKTILFSNREADIHVIERYAFSSCPAPISEFPDALDLAAVAISRITQA